MQDRLLKGGVAGLAAISAYLAGVFTPLIFILAFFEILDYITGVTAAKKRGGLSSGAALWGAVRKIGCFVLVGVAFAFDYVVVETSKLAGLNFDWPAIFGIFSVCYLISTEGISILENLEELGVRFPLLTGALKVYRDKLSRGDAENGGGEEV